MSTALMERRKRRTDVYPFKLRVRQWAGRIGKQPKEIHVRTMKHKWASCSTTGRVTFSADLLYADDEWQEYVIVHELLHLQIPNHGKLFKAMMSALLPEWQQIASRPPRTAPSLSLSRGRQDAV